LRANGCDIFATGVTVLLAMSVYQVIVSDKLPSAWKSTPVIGLCIPRRIKYLKTTSSKYTPRISTILQAF